jgi:hypothetical protein
MAAMISCTIKPMGGKWYPRNVIRASKAFGFVPFEIVGPDNDGAPGGKAAFGVIYLNTASLVGSGGTGWTIDAGTATLVVTDEA